MESRFNRCNPDLSVSKCEYGCASAPVKSVDRWPVLNCNNLVRFFECESETLMASNDCKAHANMNYGSCQNHCVTTVCRWHEHSNRYFHLHTFTGWKQCSSVVLGTLDAVARFACSTHARARMPITTVGHCSLTHTHRSRSGLENGVWSNTFLINFKRN